MNEANEKYNHPGSRKSNRFAPFTYEKPKDLFRVKGEILIERQIKQLNEADVTDIYVVVGYMKEKFFYIEQKYGVKLIVNNQFGKKVICILCMWQRSI